MEIPSVHISASTSNEDARRTSRGRGRPPVALSEADSAALGDYTARLSSAPLAEQTRRTYASKVRQYLAWLAESDIAGEPLHTHDARDVAVDEYRLRLQTVLKRAPATINSALAAVDDFFVRRGMHPSSVKRAAASRRAPRTLSRRAAVRFYG